MQAAEEGRASDDEQKVDMHLRQNMLRSHPVMDSRAASPCGQDTLHSVGPCLMLDRDSHAADVTLLRPCRDAQDRLLWRNKTCSADT